MPRRIIGNVSCVILLAWASAGWAVGDSRMPEVHPPIGVFGSTIHSQGDVMLSYRFQREDYSGLMVGTEDVSTEEVANDPAGYTVIPTALRVSRHNFEVMWAPVEEFTLVLTLPFYEKELDWQQWTQMGGPPAVFVTQTTTKVTGFGDVALSFLYRVFEDTHSRLHVNLGLSFPSGSIQEASMIPGGDQLERLPYVMQLGSGTIDLKPGVTYNGQFRATYWGAQILGLLHAGANSQGYTKGNEYSLTGWVGRKWTRWFGTTFRLAWRQAFNPEGEDPLMTTKSPLDEASLQAWRRLDSLFGVDFYVTGGSLRGTRLSVEAGLPAYQSLDGPQLRNRWSLTAGIQYAF